VPKVKTTVTLFDQAITQIVQAAVTGLVAKQPYVLALAEPGGAGTLEPLARFTANPAGAAIVAAVGPIRQVVQPELPSSRRVLVIAPVKDGKIAAPIQMQR
jgi:hypothetical protein